MGTRRRAGPRRRVRYVPRLPRRPVPRHRRLSGPPGGTPGEAPGGGDPPRAQRHRQRRRRPPPGPASSTAPTFRTSSARGPRCCSSPPRSARPCRATRRVLGDVAGSCPAWPTWRSTPSSTSTWSAGWASCARRPRWSSTPPAARSAAPAGRPAEDRRAGHARPGRGRLTVGPHDGRRVTMSETAVSAPSASPRTSGRHVLDHADQAPRSGPLPRALGSCVECPDGTRRSPLSPRARIYRGAGVGPCPCPPGRVLRQESSCPRSPPAPRPPHRPRPATVQIDPRGPRFAATLTTVVLAVAVLAPSAADRRLLAAQAVVFALGAAPRRPAHAVRLAVPHASSAPARAAGRARGRRARRGSRRPSGSVFAVLGAGRLRRRRRTCSARSPPASRWPRRSSTPPSASASAARSTCWACDSTRRTTS